MLFIINTKQKLIFFIFFVMVVFFAYSVFGDELLNLLRFDEYSVTSRFAPIEFALGLIHYNTGFPFGLAVMNESLRSENVDNSYLNIAIEAGIFGIILIAVFSISLMRWVRRIQSSLQHVKPSNNGRIIYIVPALLVHAMFETMLFSSLNITTIVFWIAITVYYRSSIFVLNNSPPCQNSCRLDRFQTSRAIREE